MLETQKSYLKFTKSTKEALGNCGIPTEKLHEIEEMILETELIIPLVGSFSAGKSSLINTFLGVNYLPVGITPETSLATELRYGITERIEAVKKNESIDVYRIEEIDKIKDVAGNYKFLRVFLNNERIKSIEPLVLVDMPGFDSPLDLHNQAIVNYLVKGVYYIVVVSVEQGGITKSLMKRLYEIRSVERDFSIVLNKRDLRAESEAMEIAKNIEESLFEAFSEHKSVIVTSMFDNDGLQKILKSIDPEKLFENIFCKKVKYVYFETIETINTLIAGMKKSSEEIETAIAKMSKSIHSLQENKEKIMSEICSKYSHASVNNIIDAVASDLRESVDELADAIIYRGQDEFIRLVNEIIRSRLISELKELFSNVGKSIVEQIKLELYDVNSAINLINSNSDWIENLTAEVLYAVSNIGYIFARKNRTVDSEDIESAITKIIGTLFILTDKLPEIAETLIFLLSSIISKIAEKFQKESIRNAIITQVIPSIKRELRKLLVDLIDTQIKEMVKSVSDTFSEEIRKKIAELEAIETEKKNQIEDVKSKLNCYTDVKNKIQTLAEPLLFQGR